MSDRPYLLPHQHVSGRGPVVEWEINGKRHQFELTPVMVATWSEMLADAVASYVRGVERERGR